MQTTAAFIDRLYRLISKSHQVLSRHKTGSGK